MLVLLYFLEGNVQNRLYLNIATTKKLQKMNLVKVFPKIFNNVLIFSISMRSGRGGNFCARFPRSTHRHPVGDIDGRRRHLLLPLLQEQRRADHGRPTGLCRLQLRRAWDVLLFRQCRHAQWFGSVGAEPQCQQFLLRKGLPAR